MSDKAYAAPQSEAAQLAVSAQTDQIVIVRAHADTTCDIALHERIDGVWQITYESQGVVGSGGVGEAREGLSVTPAGAFGLGFAFGIGENPGTQMEYRQVTDGIVWVDDPSSAYYNQWVDTSLVAADWSSGEHLASSGGAYRYCALIQYNTDPVVPGVGSAFFFHCYSISPSQGCVQTGQDDMVAYLSRLRDGAMIVIANGDDVLAY